MVLVLVVVVVEVVVVVVLWGSKRVKPRAVLGAVPAAVGVVVLDDRGVLLDDLGPSATAGHGRAQEDVYDEHYEEQHAQGDGQVH